MGAVPLCTVLQHIFISCSVGCNLSPNRYNLTVILSPRTWCAVLLVWPRVHSFWHRPYKKTNKSIVVPCHVLSAALKRHLRSRRI